MTPRPLQGGRVLGVGAGIMGTGIAQTAARAGQAVALFDARPGAAQQSVAHGLQHPGRLVGMHARHRVSSPRGAALAFALAPKVGPFEWLADWHAAEVQRLLDALDADHRGERYRVSPWLRRKADAA